MAQSEAWRQDVLSHEQFGSSQHNKPEGYDPQKSHTTREALASWVQCIVSGKLNEVPGIGDTNAQLLNMSFGNEMGVSTTFELIGKFLSFKRAGVDPIEHCNLFWHWLKNKGVVSHRNSIVQAIAEKCNILFPGIYDESLFLGHL